MMKDKVTDASFDSDVIKSATPVLVDFWAPWCGPCRMVEPILKEISKDLEGDLVVAKVNIDENSKVVQQYGISSIPTMILFKDGAPVDSFSGAAPKEHIKNWLASHGVA